MTLCSIESILREANYYLDPLVTIVPGSCPAQDITNYLGDEVAVLWLAQPMEIELRAGCIFPTSLVSDLSNTGVSFI